MRNGLVPATIKNKELLRQKALQLGYDQDPQAVGARASLTAYHAGMALWNDVIGEPANTISEEERQIQEVNAGFYAIRLGELREDLSSFTSDNAQGEIPGHHAVH